MYDRVKSIEGLEKKVHKEMYLKYLLDRIFNNVKSAFTYLGASNIEQARKHARFVEVGKGSIKEL